MNASRKTASDNTMHQCLAWSGPSAIKGIKLDAAWLLLAWPYSLIRLPENGPDLDLASSLFKLPNRVRSAKEIAKKTTTTTARMSVIEGGTCNE
jgi:hypothetical protein